MMEDADSVDNFSITTFASFPMPDAPQGMDLLLVVDFSLCIQLIYLKRSPCCMSIAVLLCSVRAGLSFIV